MFSNISRLDRLSLWGTGLKAGLAALAAAVMFTTLSPASAQQPTDAPPVSEAPVAAPDAAAPPVEAVAPPEAAPVEAAPVEEEAAPAAVELTIDKGDTTWMLISTVLVLLMIIPGLALFYGGLVRS
jgi:Amt family ammonium transporter